MEKVPKCRLTVLKCCFDRELKETYVSDPDYGPCPYFQKDMHFVSDGSRPENFGCGIGWRSIEQEVRAMCLPEPHFKQQVVCCNDGIRPVLFLLEQEDLQ